MALLVSTAPQPSFYTMDSVYPLAQLSDLTLCMSLQTTLVPIALNPTAPTAYTPTLLHAPSVFPPISYTTHIASHHVLTDIHTPLMLQEQEHVYPAPPNVLPATTVLPAFNVPAEPIFYRETASLLVLPDILQLVLRQQHNAPYALPTASPALKTEAASPASNHIRLHRMVLAHLVLRDIMSLQTTIVKFALLVAKNAQLVTLTVLLAMLHSSYSAHPASLLVL